MAPARLAGLTVRTAGPRSRDPGGSTVDPGRAAPLSAPRARPGLSNGNIPRATPRRRASLDQRGCRRKQGGAGSSLPAPRPGGAPAPPRAAKGWALASKVGWERYQNRSSGATRGGRSCQARPVRAVGSSFSRALASFQSCGLRPTGAPGPRGRARHGNIAAVPPSPNLTEIRSPLRSQIAGALVLPRARPDSGDGCRQTFPRSTPHCHSNRIPLGDDIPASGCH